MAYSERSDIEQRFGVTNVDRWADLDSDSNATNITARITAAILRADSIVDEATLGGVYPVPWSTVPNGIMNASAQLAGIWMHDSHPLSGVDGTSGFKNLMEQTMDYLKKVATGAVRFAITHEEIVPLIVKDC